jgi:hypothetical protein
MVKCASVFCFLYHGFCIPSEVAAVMQFAWATKHGATVARTKAHPIGFLALGVLEAL